MTGAEWTQTLITALLGGGGVAFVTALFRGWSDLRGGARAREREALLDLAAARDDAEERRATAERDRDFWHHTAARYGYQLRSHGHNPDPETPVPPSERDDGAPPARRGRHRRD